MFSQRHYEEVAQAYLRGLARCRQPGKIASVASFFVSRIDTVVDRALEENGSAEALALRGKIAIANAKVAYRRFREIFHGEAFRGRFAQRGAHVQRVLWASTGVKNPEVPGRSLCRRANWAGNRQHHSPGHAGSLSTTRKGPRRNCAPKPRRGRRAVAKLADRSGIDLDDISEKLQLDGIAAFAAAYDRVVAALDKKSHGIIASEPTGRRSSACNHTVPEKDQGCALTATPMKLDKTSMSITNVHITVMNGLLPT